MTYGEIISDFKKREEAGSVFVLLENKKLAEALSVWSSVPIIFDGTIGYEGEPIPTKQWEWLWNHAKVDLVTYAMVLGVSPEEAKNLAARVIGLRLAYPDGSINQYCKQYLSVCVMGKVSKMKGRQPKE